MSSRILLVESDPRLVLTITDLLTAEGYAVETAADGPAGVSKALSESFDLVVLEMMLPRTNGFEICRELRRRGKDAPILMLAAKPQLTDHIVGLRMGPDDYLAKPFKPSELLARVAALLRRVKKEKLTPVVRFEFGSVEIDFQKGLARKAGAPVGLAGKELDLLRYLIDHRGAVVSRDELLQIVWDYQPGVSSRTIDVHVAWLRHKLEDNPQNPQHIHTVRGVGYRFSA
jgi:two-component system, OmpR family, alkaline phosphatase synthesis response regulator PhoP